MSLSFLVESYWPGITESQALAMGLRARDVAAESRRTGQEIRFVASYLVATDEATLCLFEAGSLAVVEENCRRAELPYERIVPVVPIGVDPAFREPGC